MSNTKIKSSQFHGVVGHGTDGYFLITNGDGSMSWIANIVNPVISSLSYPGSVTAADPAGGETITITGTGFKTGAAVTVGGTAAPSVSYVSATSLTITTPAKTAGDYDVVVTNTDGGTATSVNGISFNGIPSWTTAAGTLGTFASDTTISTITLQASEPDAGTITFSITNGALPTGLSLTGADIDGTTTLETADTLYTFTVTATDDETQTTPRTFTITVTKQFINTENFTINTYTGNGSTQSIEGKIGTAASFNGSSSYIDLGSTVDDPLRTAGEFGVSLWFNADSYGTNPVIFKLLNDTYVYIFLNGSNQLECRVVDSSDTSRVVTTSVSLNTWYHVVWTGDSTNGVTLYLNGSSVGNTSWNGTFLTYTNSSYKFNYLGYNGSNNGWYTGKIDQVRIFDKAISSSEVTTLYGESNTSTTKSTTDIFDDGSGIALYEFEEGAKDTGGVTGYIGAGGIFNGSSSTISTSLTTNYSNLSISCWVKFNALPTGNADATLVSKGFYVSGTNTQYLHLRYEDFTDQFTFAIRQNSTYNLQATSGVTASVGVWYHVVGTLDSSGNAQIYVNGSAGTGITSAPTMTNSNDFEIGSFISTSAILNGVIDQVRIFDKALSSSEVTTLYGETAASSTKSTTDIFSDSSGIALYELEGNANDSGRFGRGAIDSGQSAVFNGSSSHIDLGTTNFAESNNSFTISAWCYFDTLASPNAIVTKWNNAGVNESWGFWHYNGGATTLHFAHRQADNTVTSAYSNSGALTANQWQHCVLVWNGDTVTFYVNGSNVGTTTNSGFNNPTKTSSANIIIGAQSEGSGVQCFDGKIDQVRIYSSALSASDVEALASEANVPTANLVAHYKLDGDATDETTNYNGTASNITYSDPAEYPTYDGTATNVSYAYDGTPTNVSFLGTSFQPDLVWIKIRTQGYNHYLLDSVRGDTEVLQTNLTDAESTQSTSLTSFDTNGFTVGSKLNVNANNEDFVAWCWKAASSDSTNTDGTITSTVRANQDAGFSIVKYSGTNTVSDTVGHGLSSPPEMVIIKNISATKSWAVRHADLDSTKNLFLNATNQATTITTTSSGGVGVINSTTVGFASGGTNASNVNISGNDFIAYCFTSITGYQSVGSYTGTGNTATNTISFGFSPRFVLIKRTDSTGGWRMYDGVRDSGNVPKRINHNLRAESSAVEYDATSDLYGYMSFTSDGVEFSTSEINPDLNALNGTYIYLAIK